MTKFAYFLLIISGISAGFVTAAAYVAFISMLGIFPKFAAKTKTAANCMLYENCLIAGILLATLLQFFTMFHSANILPGALPPTGVGIFILIFVGLFGGIYIGFLIGGLSEILNVIPIYARKTHITNRLPWVIFFIALGKGCFTLIQILIMWT